MVEGEPLPAETTFSRSAFDVGSATANVLYAAGTRGVGRYGTGNSLLDSAAYITRFIERANWSCAIAKDLGLLFMTTTTYKVGYQILSFEVKMIGYVDEQTPEGDDILIISDPQGQLYVELMPAV